jgi:uncharacterized protein (DUF3820 family)
MIFPSGVLTRLMEIVAVIAISQTARLFLKPLKVQPK